MLQTAKINPKRRVHPRIDTQVKAVVLLHDALKWGCTIGNFCPGGLYLDHRELDDGYDKNLVRHGEHLQVCFQTSSGSGEQRFEVEVKVAHAFDHGIGVSFLKNEPAIIQALTEIPYPETGQPAGPFPSELAAAKDSSLVTELSNSTRLFFTGQFPEFGTQMEEALGDAAEKAESNEAQADYLQASASIHETLGSVQHDFIEKSLAGLNNFFYQRSEAPEQKSGDIIAGKLALVENDLFEEWVWLSGLISSVESKLNRDLYALEQRLSQAANHPVDQESNPVGPHSLAWTFKETLSEIDIELPAKRVIYKCLGKRMAESLGNLYSELNGVLTKHGIMEVIPLTVRQSHAVTDTPADNESLKQPPDDEVVANDSVSAEKYEALRSLIASTPLPATSLSNGQNSGNQPMPGSFEYGPEQVLKALPAISPNGHGPLAGRILRSLNNGFPELDGKGVLGGEIQQMIGVTDQLIQTFERDGMLAPALQSPLATVQTSLLQTVLETPELLSEESHPARKVFNDLGQLSTFLSGTDDFDARNRELSRAVNIIIQKMGEIPPDGKDRLGAIPEELSVLVEKEKRQFESKTKLVLEACQGESRLREAKSVVSRLLQEKMGSGDIPLVLANLLTLSWPSLLVLTWLKEGVESPAWLKYTSVLDRLLKWLDTSQDNPPEARSDSIRLLQDMKAGFAESASNPVKIKLLLKTLAKGLLGSNARFERLKSKRIKITPASIHKIVHNERNKEIAPPGQQRPGRWLRTVLLLTQGDWIIENRKPAQKRPLKLIWRSEDASRFVFVNGTGLKVLDCNAGELAEGFRTRRYVTMRDGELPLMDRSIHQLHRTTFEKNSAEITTDHITGLFNRRVFEQKLQNALESSWDDSSQHILFTINIDQFKLVNNAFGYEAGNHLLNKIGSILHTYSTDDTTLARLGDSAFGILVQDCTEKLGVKFAKTQRAAINNYMFSWGERKLTISTSTGLVVVDEKAKDIYTLLRDADTACFLAKESGKNIIRIYEAGNRELDKQRLLANSASGIDDFIQNDRLVLFLQPIVPIRPESGLRSHYEVLLRVLDDNGEPNVPVDIIEAAEAYDRMQELDRWVISSLFRWLADHPVEAPGLGGFSLNLSGQSIGDNDMLDFIEEKLTSTRFPLERIAFEITETATISQTGKARAFVERIQKKGCEFYLDDFGTGLSSYEYLKNYAVDCIKIDGSFIQHILENKADLEMVKSITNIGHFMKKRVIAEYVETDEIRQLLGVIGVDYAQGWGVGKPFPLADLIA